MSWYYRIHKGKVRLHFSIIFFSFAIIHGEFGFGGWNCGTLVGSLPSPLRMPSINGSLVELISCFKKIWQAMFFIIMWSLWKERNSKILNNTSTSSDDEKDLIIVRLVWWIKGWEVNFPNSSFEVLQNPICLRGVSNVAAKKPPLTHVKSVLWSPPLNSCLIKWNMTLLSNLIFLELL